MRSEAPKGAAVVLLSLAAALAAGGVSAQDLQTEPTTKVLTPEPGTTTLTPGTGATGKPSSGPTTTTSATASKGKGSPSGAPSTRGSASGSASQDPPEEPPPAAATSASSGRAPSGKVVFERRSVSLGVADLAVSFKAPADWPELAKDKLPEVPPNPDVTLSVERGFGVHEPSAKPPEIREVVVVCGRASAEYWADNIRDAAFTQMLSAAEAEAKKYSELSSIEPEAQRPVGDRVEQPFAAEAPLSGGGKQKKGGETAKLQGLSFIGFYKDGGATNVVACSIACANVVSDGAGAGVCGDVIGSLEISGAFVPAPKRSWLAQIVFALKQNPTMMWLVVIGGAFALLVSILLPILLIRRRRAKARLDHHDHDEDHHDDHDDDHDGHDDAGYQEGYLAGVAAARAAALAGLEGLHASPPPEAGYFDPQTLARR